MVALYRPGPMQHIPRFIDSRHGKVQVTYPHPDLANVLDETFGVIVYQDQVMLIVQQFAGYTLGQADIMRKAMGKKKAEIMVEERGRFVAGAVAKGYTEEDATAVFDLIEPFAGYAFNKAHSWCYGHIAYQTAWLKANYPVQYMTALLRLTKSAPDTHARIAAAVAECTKLGIEVLPPDINMSYDNFSVEKRQDGSLAIRFGLGVVKNVGSTACEGIIAEREKGGIYRDIEDFCKRADLSGANSRVLEHLAKAGAFDLIGGPPGPYNRHTLAINAERLALLAKKERELKESGQSTMFDLFGSQVDTPLPTLDLEEVPARKEDMLAWEKELLGVYVSEHPFKAVAQDVGRFATHTLADLGQDLAGQTVTVAGMVSRVNARTTRDGRKFYVVDLEDLAGNAELTVWSDTIELTGEEIWAEGRVLVCSVELRDRGDRVNLNVRKAAPYDSEAGTVVGFVAEQWQVEQPKRRPRMDEAPGDGSAPQSQRPSGYAPNGGGNGGYRNGSPAPGGQRTNGHAYTGATAEASRPGTATTVNADHARLTITMFETEDELADKALLKTIVGMLNDHPGTDEVRLVVRDTAGDELEFDFPRASATEDLQRSLRSFLGNRGTVRVTGAKMAGAA